MSVKLPPYLDDLEARIDEDQEAGFHRAWEAFLDGRLAEGCFTPPGRRPAPPKVAWPDIHINDALDDIDLMVLRELAGVSGILAAGINAALNVRCNYGVGIMASQIGCKIVQMDRAQGDLPTSLPMGGAAIPAILDAGLPNLRAGLGAKVFDTAERFLEVLADYPKIGRWVSLYHPDAQGPIDNAELVWGSEIFYAFVDAPETIDAFMTLMTDHYAAFMRKWFALVPPRSAYACHWGLMFKGRLMLREDSLMNLAPETYERLIFAHDQRLLREFGGGAVHYCGRGEHFIELMSRTEGLTAVNLSQPHLNDMDAILNHTIDKGLYIIGLNAAAIAALARRDLRGRVHTGSGGSLPSRQVVEVDGT